MFYDDMAVEFVEPRPYRRPVLQIPFKITVTSQKSINDSGNMASKHLINGYADLDRDFTTLTWNNSR